MVTGKRAFARNTVAETLVAIIREQAEPIAVQNPEAPAPLCWAIERCLAKDPDKRYVSTRDLARELAAIRDRFSEKPARQAEPRPANIPVQRTAFVGREKEIAAAKELLLSTRRAPRDHYGHGRNRQDSPGAGNRRRSYPKIFPAEFILFRSRRCAILA